MKHATPTRLSITLKNHTKITQKHSHGMITGWLSKNPTFQKELVTKVHTTMLIELPYNGIFFACLWKGNIITSSMVGFICYQNELQSHLQLRPNDPSLRLGLTHGKGWVHPHVFPHCLMQKYDHMWATRKLQTKRENAWYIQSSRSYSSWSSSIRPANMNNSNCTYNLGQCHSSP